MKSNFTFLKEKWPLLYSIGNMAERYIYTDSNSCLYKLGLFGENIVNFMFNLDGIESPEENTHANRNPHSREQRLRRGSGKTHISERKLTDILLSTLWPNALAL